MSSRPLGRSRTESQIPFQRRKGEALHTNRHALVFVYECVCTCLSVLERGLGRYLPSEESISRLRNRSSISDFGSFR